jgi:uncharacterized Zn-binding protein involved in type VI secretion
MCPLVDGAGSHGGGPLLPPGAAQVLIGGKPAMRVMGMATCVGPLDLVKKGAPMVLIEGLHAARKADPTLHGGVIMDGFAMVLIGGATPPTSDAETIEDAIDLIRTSDFAKTAEGQKVLARLENMQKEGDISYQRDDPHRGEYKNDDKISLSDDYNRDPQGTASELVHEGTHAVAADEDAWPSHKNSIDEEMRTNTNQNNFYQEQRNEYQSDELDRRSQAAADGTLRDDIRGRYPKTPEQ